MQHTILSNSSYRCYKFSDWGEAVLASEVTLEPGLWSLDNFGQVLIATIANGKTFTWNAGAATPLTTRHQHPHLVLQHQQSNCIKINFSITYN